MILRTPLLLIALMLAWPAQAEDGCPRRRNVDCTSQARAISTAIAADPALTQAEAAIAERVAALTAALAPPGAAALTREDALRRRARGRELFFTADGTVEAESMDMLGDALAWHRAWLDAIDPAPPPGLAGRWAGAFIVAEIAPGTDGRFAVGADAVEPFHLAWLCEFDDTARLQPDGALVSEDGTLRIHRDGPVLVIEPIPRPGLAGYDYCGAMGSLRGVLFATRPQNPTQAPR